MIAFELLSAAVYTLVGIAALIVVLTQMVKNLVWKNGKEEKRWVNHLISFCVATVCNFIVLWIGMTYGVGIYAVFSLASLTDWIFFSGVIIGSTGIANGLWSYEFMQKFLEWIKLLPKPENK